MGSHRLRTNEDNSMDPAVSSCTTAAIVCRDVTDKPLHRRTVGDNGANRSNRNQGGADMDLAASSCAAAAITCKETSVLQGMTDIVFSIIRHQQATAEVLNTFAGRQLRAIEVLSALPDFGLGVDAELRRIMEKE